MPETPRIVHIAEHGPLSWDDVNCLREVGLHGAADLAEDLVRAAERKRNRWYRRLWRKLVA